MTLKNSEFLRDSDQNSDQNQIFFVQTGVRPLVKPSEEAHTIILNGRTDNRNYKEDQTDQYTSLTVTELVTEAGSCALPYPTADEDFILKVN